MDNNPRAKSLKLPNLLLTKLATEDQLDSIKVAIPASKCANREGFEYCVVPEKREFFDWKENEPKFLPRSIRLFPVVLDAYGTPWNEANLWLLSRVKNLTAPNMGTYHGIATNLAAYRQFLDDRKIDWRVFPPLQYQRPTYVFRNYQNRMMQLGKKGFSPNTIDGRMSAVIGFYRWQIAENGFRPEYPPWEEKEKFVQYEDRHGFKQTKHVITTDLKIKVAKQNDPYSDHIDDGGKLRPLPPNEQVWLCEALGHIGNTELALIHLFGLFTGARIQTICTFLVREVKDEIPSDATEVRFNVGPGTGIDTKNNKRLTLHMPPWFYNILRTYALSDRAKKRRLKSEGGDTDDQYLFLTKQGAPFYESRADKNTPGKIIDRRHDKRGQVVGERIRKQVIPIIQKWGRLAKEMDKETSEKYKKYLGAEKFQYRFHDTRATYGMNAWSGLIELVDNEQIPLRQAMDTLQGLLGHSSFAITQRYIDYGKRRHIIRMMQDGWESHLQHLVNDAMGLPNAK